jgi:predicted dinucleotide-binding enzyme
MKIAIIGAGNVGVALGGRWIAVGHEVTYGIRPDREAKDGLPAGAAQAPVAAAAAAAEVIVLAVPAAAAAGVLREAGSALTGKVVIDATNPVGPGITAMTGPNGESQAEQLQALVPAARVVKSFNQTGAENMADPRYPTPLVNFVAGDDPAARQVALRLARDLGFEGIEVGPLSRARELERLAMLWISLAMNPASGLGRGFGFAIARR